MGEEKRSKIMAAVRINAIILILIIVAVLIYQVVTISSAISRKKELYEELKRIERKYEGAQDILERLRNDDEYLKILEELAKLGEDVSGYLALSV